MMFQKSALDLWHEECRRPAIITGAQLLDKAIGNGVPVQVVTEFYGPPGSGKTQLCLQLCVNVQIPSQLGGLQGSAVFIDTEHGFAPARLREIATGCVQQLQRIAEKCSDLSSSSLRDFTDDLILSNILCSTVSSATELLAAVELMKHQLSARAPTVRLIVIDSLSSLFHQLPSVDRVRVLNTLISDLEQLAQKHSCAIVLTNEITTRFTRSNRAHLVPALGDTHAHRVVQQVALGAQDLSTQYLSGGQLAFVARVKKSLSCPESTVLFKITGDGIRDF